MTKPNGVHHLAISTANIKNQIEYFTDVLGMELVALYWMHGVDGAWHGFLKLNDRSSIALVQSPDIEKLEPKLGHSHAGNAGAASAPGTMQHLALNVDTDDALIAMRDRIRSRGVNVFGPIDHGFCKSIYFAGLESMTLEISTSAEPLNPDAWIDPEVVSLAGITPDELARYRAPREFQDRAGGVAQPPRQEDKPHMVYPEARYAAMLAMSDADFARERSMTEPPVQIDLEDRREMAG